ncbi:hypothetical protein Q5W_18515 [Hydrogenophaga sp. PBC]|nr:hypothetical protein Q5W_18515 [Hydrogenophaga sp. PBC]
MPDIQAAPWFAYMAPAGTPPAIVQRMNQALVAVLREPEVVEKLKGQYFDVIASTPEELGRFMREEEARWRPVIQRAGLRPD